MTMKVRILLREVTSPHIAEQNITLLYNVLEDVQAVVNPSDPRDDGSVTVNRLRELMGSRFDDKELIATLIVRKIKTLQENKIAKFVGKGRYGLAFQLQNSHIFKIYAPIDVWGRNQRGQRPSEETFFKDLMDRKFAGKGERSDLSIYDYGGIPGMPGLHYVEMNKVMTMVDLYNIGMPQQPTAADEFSQQQYDLAELLTQMRQLLHYEVSRYLEVYDANNRAVKLSKLFMYTMQAVKNSAANYGAIADMIQENPEFVKQIVVMYVKTAYKLGHGALDLRYGNFGYDENDKTTLIFYDP